MLGREYVVIEKRNVEVNALADRKRGCAAMHPFMLKYIPQTWQRTLNDLTICRVGHRRKRVCYLDN